MERSGQIMPGTLKRLLGLILVTLLSLHPGKAGEADFLAHLRYLSSDELRGRGNDQPELALAADYVAEKFARYGLRPIGDDGTFFQNLQISVGYRQGQNNALSFFGVPFSAEHLEMGEDYWPLSLGNEDSISAPLVFAGFGISAPELNYDDYRDIDVTGKVVVIYDHEPQEYSDKSPFDGTRLTPYAALLSKMLTAKHRGAVAVILLPDYFNHSSRQEEYYVHDTIDDLGIPSIRLSRQWATRLIQLSGRDSREIRRWINRNLTPYSFNLDMQVALQLDYERILRPVRNVVGMIEGESSEAIVLGAHYDHLGTGDKSSLAPDRLGEIHNGADDNASGTAGLLELAQRFSRDRPRHTLIFAAFAGEELGLLGSRHYTERPPISLDRTIAMLNMDMIGRSRGELLIGGVGTAREFAKILSEIRKRSRLSLRLAQTPRGSSDHLSFSMRQIPVLFFFSGLHEDYHRPSDDWQKIDLNRSMQVLDVVEGVVRGIDQLAGGLSYVEMGISSGEVDGPLTGSSAARAHFGSIPDMSYEENGVRFADIREGSPAERGGIRAGDVLVEFGETRIDNLYDFTYALRNHAPGDTVRVVVLRDGESLEKLVVLGEVP